jgi:hypothetical protein
VNRWRKWRRRLLWAAGGLVALVLTAWATMAALMWQWVATPPTLPQPAAISRLKPETRGDTVYLGRNWFGRRQGLPVLYLTGTPLEMGYANGALTQQFIHRHEAVLVELLQRVAPYRWTQFLLKFVTVYKNRRLAENVPLEQQVEMLGLTLGCPDAHPGLGPYYHRILNYHAAQDISYMMMNSPLIRRGCTAFGAWGATTPEGHLLLGRNFDWEPHPVFDEDRLVVICEPAEGIPFISLAWAGMVGCVSGMNRDGLSVTVNGAPSRLPSAAGTPTCLVARELLQHARTLAEATAILRRRRVFVSALFLVGSQKDGRFVVVEKTPERMAVREAGQRSYLVCANHYQTPELAEDALNQTFKRMDTSVARYARMEELLEQSAGALTPNQCAALLRDRRLPGGQSAGNGHRSSLNPLIATHAVIMDLTAGVFWAGAPPHQLGRFVAFDVNDWDRPLADKSLPEDTLLASGEYRRFVAAQAQLQEGWRALKQRQFDQAAACASLADKDNPGFYRNAWLLAESRFRQHRLNEAARACRAALEGKPALGAERKKLGQLAQAIATAQQAPRPNPDRR